MVLDMLTLLHLFVFFDNHLANEFGVVGEEHVGERYTLLRVSSKPQIAPVAL